MQYKIKLLLFEGSFIISKLVILWTLGSSKIHLQTKSNFFHVVFAEGFRPNPQVARNTLNFFHLCPPPSVERKIKKKQKMIYVP